jgi:hypothetical protein
LGTMHTPHTAVTLLTLPQNLAVPHTPPPPTPLQSQNITTQPPTPPPTPPHPTTRPPCCRHKQQDFGWWRLVGVSGGFVSHSPDPSTLCLCVALRNNLPVPLPLEGATLTLSDTQGHWQQPLLIGPGPSSSSSSSGVQAAGVPGSSLMASSTPADASTVLTAGLSQLQLSPTPSPAHATPAGQGTTSSSSSWQLQIQPGSWQQLHAVFEPRCIGTVACEAVDLRLSAGASVVFKVPSFAPGRPALGSAAVGPEGPFSLQQQVKLGSWTAKVQHVGPLPQLQVREGAFLYTCRGTGKHSGIEQCTCHGHAHDLARQAGQLDSQGATCWALPQLQVRRGVHL